ncbi:MAG: 1-deoxy-D-xylulose-5-phosphate reductoisomerase [Clostridia bacterium]
MRKKIAILGSTGSIGTQALSLIDVHPDMFEVYAMTTYSNTELLCSQIKKYQPKYVGIVDPVKGKNALKDIPDHIHTEFGEKCLTSFCALPDVDLVLIAVVGIAGLASVMECIRHGKQIALATKEALVAGGKIVQDALLKSAARILPVDSEHSAIMQCLEGLRDSKEIENLILTASGGPFRGWDYNRMINAKPEDALRHPNWEMGKKISIDSATLMNKGFEVIEARWLFNISPDHIKVVIHPESIIHSMVEFKDHSILAQMAYPDMRIPISYALNYPHRREIPVKSLNFDEIGKLTFYSPDYSRFPCLELAYHSLKEGGTSPAVLNASNEVAVSLFLQEKIGFMDIPVIVEKSLMRAEYIKNPDIEDIYYIDKWTREYILNEIVAF